MAFKMNMGDHSGNDTPENFSNNDKEVINNAPVFKNANDPNKMKPISKHASGVSYGYKYDPNNKYTVKGGIRENFNQAFKEAREGGFDTFSFGYDRNQDGTISFQQGEVKRYTTKLKGE